MTEMRRKASGNNNNYTTSGPGMTGSAASASRLLASSDQPSDNIRAPTTGTDSQNQSNTDSLNNNTTTSLSKRVIVCVLFLIGFGVFYKTFYKHMSIATLKDSKGFVDSYVDENPLLSGLLYVSGMSLVIGATLPGATFLSLCGGVFFAQPYAALYTYAGYVVGASISFVCVRYIAGDSVRNYLTSKSDMFGRFETGFRESKNWMEVVVFLIFVRYVAFFPFWFVNFSCAIIGISYRYFLLTTCIATIPGSLIYTLSGNVLADTLDTIPRDEPVSKAFRELSIKVALQPWGLDKILGFESSYGSDSSISEKSGDNLNKLILPLFGFCALLPAAMAAIKKQTEGKKA